jgi:medium-chain acyl-[acyl-carrier-protein] hydrolase
MMQLLIPIVRADLAIDEVYVYTNEAPLECPITIIGGLQDPKMSPDIIEAWNKHTIGFCSLPMFTYHHFLLNRYQLLLLQATCQKLQQNQ